MGRSSASWRAEPAVDLDEVAAVLCPRSRAELPPWRRGDALLAGGTWLFGEEQPGTTRLVDLQALRWPAVEVGGGLRLAATCTFAELARTALPAEWLAAAVVAPACDALGGSFKVQGQATVGGNLCLALPAGPIAALATALDGRCTIWLPDGGERHVRAADFVLGERRTALRPGEVLRAIDLPAAALRRRAALRRMSLTAQGRSAALLIATSDGRDLQLTVSAATRRPVRLDFAAAPDAHALADAMAAIDPLLADDVHGDPAWRRHVARLLADELRRELAP